MKFRSSTKHTIDLLFPIALLFVFAAGAVIVILFAAGIYENTVEQSHQNHQARTVVSYISEKIRQNDVENSITLIDPADSIAPDVPDGLQALDLQQIYNGETYHTYIFFYDGALQEIFVKEGVMFSWSDGKAILPLKEFTLQESSENLLYLSCTDTEGQTVSAFLSIRTQQE